MDNKTCTKCGISKELECFHKDTRHNLNGKTSMCKECAKIFARKYYHNNIEKVHAYRKKEYIKHRIKLLEKGKRWKQKTIDSWKGYFPEKINCQVCDRELLFVSNNKKLSVHFDHKTGKEKILKDPKHWLRRKPCNPENIKIWGSCNFGMLCESCNRKLPTSNRKEFLLKALEYANL